MFEYHLHIDDTSMMNLIDDSVTFTLMLNEKPASYCFFSVPAENPQGLKFPSLN